MWEADGASGPSIAWLEPPSACGTCSGLSTGNCLSTFDPGCAEELAAGIHCLSLERSSRGCAGWEPPLAWFCLAGVTPELLSAVSVPELPASAVPGNSCAMGSSPLSGSWDRLSVEEANVEGASSSEAGPGGQLPVCDGCGPRSLAAAVPCLGAAAAPFSDLLFCRSSCSYKHMGPNQYIVCSSRVGG